MTCSSADEVRKFLEGRALFSLAEAFLALLLMLCWLQEPPAFMHRQYDIVEMFAGKGRICRLAEAAGYWALAHDLAYHKPKPGANNAMDINGKAGYLLLALILV